MRQLSGLDASFLYLETANTPMHIGSLAIYDQSTAPGGKVGFKQIMKYTVDRTAALPTMSARLQEVPFSLDYPYWITDDQFDPEFHIRHLALPKPGDWRQLCILVARLHARPLDRARPLWETHIIEGLDNVEGYPEGCFAVYTKVHHAAIDGASGVEMTAATHDISPDEPMVDIKPVIQVDHKPSKTELLLRAQWNSVKQPFRMFNVAKNTIPAAAKAAAGVAAGRLRRATKPPKTRLNGSLGPHRVIDAALWDFEDIRAVKNAVPPCTVNDVAVAICGGALRKYLSAKNDLPADPLIGMAPINIRTEDKKGAGGNEVSQMSVSLATNIEDPLERLRAVNKSTTGAKEYTKAIGAKNMTDLSQFVPSTLTASAVKLAAGMGLANRTAPPYNTVVTNVPGLQVPIYYCGAKMLSTFGLGCPVESVGLFHVIGSYCGQFSITITADRAMIPDPAFYADCLRESFDDLKKAVDALPKGKPAAKKSTKKAA